jgi:hypothetical protein
MVHCRGAQQLSVKRPSGIHSNPRKDCYGEQPGHRPALYRQFSHGHLCIFCSFWRHINYSSCKLFTHQCLKNTRATSAQRRLRRKGIPAQGEASGFVSALGDRGLLASSICPADTNPMVRTFSRHLKMLQPVLILLSSCQRKHLD